ncbi:hypothetical protein HA402_010685 [Bradysia odoriphaga]|nr:hypothetical protein HA402_010685 [Bradysia odoriphaga]
MKIGLAVFLLLQFAYVIANSDAESTSQVEIAFNEVKKLASERQSSDGDGGFVRPGQQQVKELKEKVDELQDQIKLLLESSSANKTSLQNKISVLQDEIKDLKGQLDNSESASTDTINEMDRQIQDLTAQINRLTLRYLPDDCVRDIQQRRFADAEKKLKIIADKDETEDIIRRVYTHKEENILLLTDFAKSLTDKATALLIYKYLADEIKSHRDSEPIKVVILYQSIHQTFPNPILDTSTRGTVEEASRSLMRTAREMIELKFTNDIFNKDRCKAGLSFAINMALRAVIEYSHDLFIELINNIVSEVYAEKFDDIFECVSGSEFFELRIVALSATFYKMKKVDKLYKPEVFKLAAHIRDTMNAGSYAGVLLNVREYFGKVKTSLPTVVVNIMFSTKVCIKNTEYDHYLFASSSVSGNQRKVFIKSGLDNEAYWKLEMQSDYTFRIKNTKYDEYGGQNKDEGTMCTCTTKNQPDDRWDFEIVKDNGVVIRNIAAKYVLYPLRGWKVETRTVSFYPDYAADRSWPIVIWEIDDCSTR